MRRVAIVAILAMVCEAASAQDAPGPNYQHLKDYGPFIGTWRYEGPLLESLPGLAEKGDTWVIEITWKWILNKNAVEEEGFLEVAGKKIRGKSLIGWNAADEKIVYGGVDSTGSLSLGTVAFDPAKKTLTLTASGVEADGQPTSFEGVITRTGEDSYDWHAAKRTGREPEGPSPTYTFKRVKPISDAASSIPKEAWDAMNFLCGKWENVPSGNDGPVTTTSDERRWAPGGHCLIITWAGKQAGTDLYASGICGWNPATKEVVETWHISDGSWSEVRYPLAGMKDGIWKGTTSWTESDGRKRSGTCQLQQDNEDFVWTCEWTDQGEQQSVKLITRKIHE